MPNTWILTIQMIQEIVKTGSNIGRYGNTERASSQGIGPVYSLVGLAIFTRMEKLSGYF
jgi:hypothetical protein